jgi:hypothetical protein
MDWILYIMFGVYMAFNVVCSVNRYRISEGK